MQSDIIEKLKRGELPLDFNWNKDVFKNIPLPSSIPSEPTSDQILKVQLLSEDLRDGLHGISEYPSVYNMLLYVGALYKLCIRRMTVGIYSGEKSKIDRSIRRLLGQMHDFYPDVTPVVLSLTTPESLKWVGKCKEANPKVEALIFMGTAPSRLLVEEWSQKEILEKMAWATNEAIIKYSVNVIGGTEHTPQTPPDFLEKIITAYAKNGAKNFCVADTIGISRPLGTYRIIKYTKSVLKKLNKEDVKVEWHGHRDMGNDLANAMAAVAAGCDIIHTVARGIGERAGNAQLEAILLNFNAILEEENKPNPWNMGELMQVLTMYNSITHIPTPYHGVLSRRAFTTSLGIHTAAMLKAETLAKAASKEGDKDLAKRLERMSRRIYTAVDPKLIGGKHVIHVGPWSGISTVKFAFISLGGNAKHLTNETINHVLFTARKLGRELTQEELSKLLFDNR